MGSHGTINRVENSRRLAGGAIVFDRQTNSTCPLETSRYLKERTSDTLLMMPFSSRVGNITATVRWAAEPLDSHMRVHTWTWGGGAVGGVQVHAETK